MWLLWPLYIPFFSYFSGLILIYSSIFPWTLKIFPSFLVWKWLKVPKFCQIWQLKVYRTRSKLSDLQISVLRVWIGNFDRLSALRLPFWGVWTSKIRNFGRKLWFVILRLLIWSELENFGRLSTLRLSFCEVWRGFENFGPGFPIILGLVFCVVWTWKFS